MNEHLLSEGNEHLLAAETKSSHENHEGAPNDVETRAFSQEDISHGNQEQLKKLQESIEKHSASGDKQTHLAEHEQPKPSHPLIAGLREKKVAWNRQMVRMRKRLNPVDRIGSRIIHSPIIDKPSEFVGKTIARPQGMLWGSVVAFIGTSALLWVTNHYGYEFNYLLVVLLFLGGSLFGTAIEGLTYLTRKNR